MEFLTIEDMAAALAERRVSARELADRHLARIARGNDRLHAFARVFAEPARAAADASDRLRSTGRPLGPLHGVPLGVKDLFHYAGHPTEGGSKALAGVVSTETASAVARLEAAGMVVLGKTHTVEFAFGGWGTNDSLGTPWNPWDGTLHRVPGGSSSGSAVAVAADLAPAALGTDTGGSVRIPAGLCGLVGLKSSRGLVGRGGVLPLCPTHDTVGPLVRSVRDAALLMQAMAGHDPQDVATDGAPALDYLAEIERGGAGLRIGYLHADDLQETDPAVRDLFDRALGALTDLGCTLTPLRLPRPLDAYMTLAGSLMSAESYRHLAAYVDAEPSLVQPSIRERVQRGRWLSASQYMALLEARIAAQHDITQAMDRIDAFVAPTCPITAIPVDEVDEDKTPLSAYGRFVNFLDLASLSIPIGLAPDGLPAGLQIIVRRFDDPLALRIGRALECRAGFVVRPAPWRD